MERLTTGVVDMSSEIREPLMPSTTTSVSGCSEWMMDMPSRSASSPLMSVFFAYVPHHCRRTATGGVQCQTGDVRRFGCERSRDWKILQREHPRPHHFPNKVALRSHLAFHWVFFQLCVH